MAYLSKNLMKEMEKEAREQKIINNLKEEVSLKNKTAIRLLKRIYAIDELQTIISRSIKNGIDKSQRDMLRATYKTRIKTLRAERRTLLHKGSKIGNPRAYLLKKLVRDI